MSTAAYHNKRRYSKPLQQSGRSNSIKRAFGRGFDNLKTLVREHPFGTILAGVTAVGLAGYAIHAPAEQGTESRPNGAGTGALPVPGPTKEGGQGGGQRSGNLCRWQTPAVQAAANRAVGSETACGGLLDSTLTGAEWRGPNSSVSIIVGSDTVPASALRDPNSNFSKNWREHPVDGAGPDTFCRPANNSILVYQEGGYAISINMNHESGPKLPPGCSEALGAFASAVVTSGMADPNQG